MPEPLPEPKREQVRLLAAAAAIVVVATALAWFFVLPDRPDMAVQDSAAAAMVASMALLGKAKRHRKR
ncbi:hypothetical protein [Methylobacterium oxalidis]|uniref:Uncharacterized protein n=1 Tax=Methylobacterium oxalidis TaxID=944322 RepID=A0A512JD41_9HYPH|nr:hypothetical protein [Methylobacterium oxalidis]GEP07827.1 hypothetical protein MOX02_58650 [Methylobacterium oxalidis]GJE35281.1 hypothetical protein LDDCCGHA_5499 [Methylobacterium oxalidis]GLS64877.1 hypothetical protein GCM10007888_32580 [Methylobacterium oxalidis]